MKCAELLVGSLHEPSISTVTSVRFVFNLSLIGSSYPFCRLASSCFFFLEDHTVFFVLTLKETDLLNQPRVNFCNGK